MAVINSQYTDVVSKVDRLAAISDGSEEYFEVLLSAQESPFDFSRITIPEWKRKVRVQSKLLLKVANVVRQTPFTIPAPYGD